MEIVTRNVEICPNSMTEHRKSRLDFLREIVKISRPDHHYLRDSKINPYRIKDRGQTSFKKTYMLRDN